MKTYAIEMTVAVDAAGTLRTLYVSSGPLVTGPDDTPPHTAFMGRVQQPALYRTDLWEPGTTGGASRVSTGEVVLVNVDEALDDWIGYGWAGREIVLRVGEPGTAYPTAWSRVLTGTMEQATFEGDRVVIRVRDRQAVLDVPASPNTYAGDNALPAGLEGGADDLADQRKPRCWGLVRNVSPPCVNSARLIYQVSDGSVSSVDAVYDRGVALTAGAVYASQAEMETTAPAAGSYRVWPAGGYVRLGSLPAGQLTADVTATTGTTARAGSLLQSLALTAGLAAGDVSAADVSALNAAAPYALGLWLPSGDETTCRAAMDRVAASVGAWWAFDSLGVLRMGQLVDPAGDVPAMAIESWQIMQIQRQAQRDAGAGVPAWRVTVNGNRNWSVQSDVAGAVTAARRTWLAMATRPQRSAQASIKLQHLQAADLVVDSLIDTLADAKLEAQRLLALYRVRRDMFEVRISASASALASLSPGCSVRLTWKRYGLQSGRMLRVLGVQLDLARERAYLTLWG
ncbi:hypothetical protein [uncultured Azohydromonas sp.]|jgi:hypothetical protein|uniref:hypothetical protein n=1 Tax=uncultured Azohydromonas sp. TaxID=487342 RepID=UPI00260A2517|nr:hypothetical protein [uncultured Azohydromonas sp.]